MSLPAAIIGVLAHFELCFTQPTWCKAVLLVDTTLAWGRRTVTRALRLMGHSRDPDFSCFHQVLNRALATPRRQPSFAALARRYL